MPVAPGEGMKLLTEEQLEGQWLLLWAASQQIHVLFFVNAGSNPHFDPDKTARHELTSLLLSLTFVHSEIYQIIHSQIRQDNEEYRDAFDIFDRDGNGKVSSDELGPLMRSLGANPKDEHLQELINEVDYDGDGVLNFTEFIDLMMNDKPEIEEDLELIEAFRSFDTEDTGLIDSADLREAFYRMDEAQTDIEDLIDATNVRVDRKVTYDEFVALTVIQK